MNAAMLLMVPGALFAMCGLLMAATALEQRRVRVFVRMTVRSKHSSPDLVERVIAAELAPVLRASGLSRP